MKVVINACFGGFSLSPEAELALYEAGCTDIATHVDKYWPPMGRMVDDRFGYAHALEEWRKYKSMPPDKRASLFLTTFTPDEQYVLNARDVDRRDTRLIRVVEEMREAANGGCAALHIVEIPDGVDYEIEEYDGNEHIAEKHRTWR